MTRRKNASGRFFSELEVKMIIGRAAALLLNSALLSSGTLKLNFSIAANAHVLKVFNFSLEGGIAGARALRTFNATNEKIADTGPGAGPYFGASVRYVTTKSKFSSKFLNKVGIGL